MKIKHGIIICSLMFTLGANAPAFAAEQAETPAPAILCHNGSFTGVKLDNGVYAYIGIPFAKPPVGPLRWKAPVDVDDSQGSFRATQYGKRPLQSILGSDEDPSSAPMGEDCLYLNVWTADPNIKGKPVMVYFHGGAYGWESAADPFYDFRNMAKENPDIVFVSAEYRVNAMGFIDLSRVPDGKVYKAADFKDSTQLGVLDNICALRWVNRNIEAFGGDKGNITVWGESAGGGISSILMIAKQAKGLFQRAIPMSGAANLTIPKGTYERMDQAGAIMEATGCKDLDDLMALSEQQILEAFKQPTERIGLEGVGGVAHLNGQPLRGDGGIVPIDPMQAIADGAGGDIDMMIGTVADEWRYWVREMELPTLEENMQAYYGFMKGAASYIRKVGLASKEDILIDVNALLDIVEAESDEWDAKHPGIWKYTEINNEKTFRMPAIAQAEAHVKSGGKGRTYMYYFAKRSTVAPWIGACHSVELPYIFLNPQNPAITGKVDMELAKRASRAWTNFARTGNPSIEGIAWPEYDLINRATMVIGNDNSFQVVNDPKREQREFLQNAQPRKSDGGGTRRAGKSCTGTDAP